MSGFIRVGGVDKSLTAMSIYVGGVAKTVVAAWVYVGGVAKQFFALCSVLNGADESRWVMSPDDWEGRATFDVGANTQSVSYRWDDGGGWQGPTTVDTTPSGSGYATGWKAAPGLSIQFELTPYTGDGATGDAGTPVTVVATQPPIG